jgi:hypothetical protein
VADETTFRIKQNDLEPSLRVQLLDLDDPVTTLGTATAIRCIVTTRDGLTELVNRAMSVVDAPNGWVELVWQAGDTTTLGTFRFEVEVMWPGARPQTFPVAGYGRLVVHDDLG